MDKNFYEELNELWEELTESENNNFRSDKAKTALIKKYNATYDTDLKKGDCFLHHINGDHNDDKDLANDVLIVADDREDAELAHKILHLLSYCYLEDELKAKLKELNVEFYYHPDSSNKKQRIGIETLANGLAQHDKALKKIGIIDEDA